MFHLSETSAIYGQKIIPEKEYIFIGTYNGLSKDIEFEFIDDKGKNYIFQEIGDEVTIDLFEEENIDKKFEITWINETREVVDAEGESTGETQKIKMIIWLKAL